MTGVQKAINREVYKVIERLGGDAELLAVIGNYGDTLSDEDVLSMLRGWNAGRAILQSRFEGGRE